jgi:superfamily II DNA or RNA helicase
MATKRKTWDIVPTTGGLEKSIGLYPAPHQIEAEEANIHCIETGHIKAHTIMPCGAGKSVVIAGLANYGVTEKKGKVLIVTHRKEILNNNLQKIRDRFPNLKVGLEKANSYCPKGADIMVASIDTIGEEGLKRLRDFASLKEFSMIIVDEIQRVPNSKRYNTLLEAFRVENPNVIQLGLTATPILSNGKDARNYFPGKAYMTSRANLEKHKFLATMKAFTIESDTDLGSLANTTGEFNEEELEKIVNNLKRNQLIVDTYLENCKKEKAVTFCCNKSHAEELLKLCTSKGIRAVTITDDTPKKERDLLNQKIENNEIDMAISVMCLTEGWHNPNIRHVFNTRPLRSTMLMEQIHGRGSSMFLEPTSDGKLVANLAKKSEYTIWDIRDKNQLKAKALTLGEFVGMPEFKFEGQAVSEIQEMAGRAKTVDPLLTASIAKAISEIDLKRIICKNNLIDAVKAFEFDNESDLLWMKGHPSSYTNLCYEAVRLHKTISGNFEAHFPEIQIHKRKEAEIKRQTFHRINPIKIPSHLQGRNIRPERIPLAADTYEEARRETEAFIKEILPDEYKNLLHKDAAWRKKKEPASPKQIEFLKGMQANITEDQYKTLTKTEASIAIDLQERKIQGYLSQNIAPFGKFEGKDMRELLVTHRDELIEEYFDNTPDSNTTRKIRDRISLLDQRSPILWLKEKHPEIYEKHFTEYFVSFQRNPEKVYKAVAAKFLKETQTPKKKKKELETGIQI